MASLYVQKRALLGGGLLSLLVLVSILSLAEFWSNPRYRADDHRQAVATLAAEWRPGDVILANAGWIYPIIDVYWPTGWMALRPWSRPNWMTFSVSLTTRNQHRANHSSSVPAA